MAVIDLKSRLKITLVPFRFLLEDICPDIYFRRFAVDTNFNHVAAVVPYITLRR
jgi:hypothetical protein